MINNPSSPGRVLNILLILTITDQYCSRAVVVKNAFVHKEETEVGGGFQ